MSDLSRAGRGRGRGRRRRRFPSSSPPLLAALLLLVLLVFCSFESVRGQGEGDVAVDPEEADAAEEGGGEPTTYPPEALVDPNVASTEAPPEEDDANTTETNSTAAPPEGGTTAAAAATTTSTTSTTTRKYLGVNETRKMNPLSNHIALRDYVEYLHSEVNEEFAYKEGQTENDEEATKRAERHWESVIEFEWGRCLREEVAWNNRCPFVLCHFSDPTRDHFNMSGNMRQKELWTMVADASSEYWGYEETNVADNLKAVYNSAGLWCGYARVHATVAERIESKAKDIGKYVSVTPVMMQMKMMPSTVRRMLQVIQYLYRAEGVGDKIPDFVRRGRRMLVEMEEEDEKNAIAARGGNVEEEMPLLRKKKEEDRNLAMSNVDDRTRWNFPTADILICPGYVTAQNIRDVVGLVRSRTGSQEVDPRDLEVTAEMTAWMFAKQVEFSDPDIQDFVEGNMYWTSEYSKHLREEEGGETNQRGEFWREVFEHTLHDKSCDVTWTTKLQWRANLAPPPDMSTLSVTYDRGEVGDADDWCIISMIAAIAAHGGVCSVGVRSDLEPEFNAEASMMVQGGIDGRWPWFDSGLDGTGQVVAVSDTGIDLGNCYMSDEDGRQATGTRDDTRRKVVEYHANADNLDDEHGHGTHVVTTVAGRLDENSGSDVNSADGVARGAKIAFMDLGTPDGRLWVPSHNQLFNTGRGARVRDNNDTVAKIHSASWGASEITNGYTGQSAQFDDYMYRNDDFIVIAAAGNDGHNDLMNSVSSPATFKNGITVGASHIFGGGQRADFFSGGQDKDLLGPTFLADFSSRGPTRDGRRKPEVVAPGKNIMSGGVDLNGDPDACHPLIASKAGTSMATPVVSGTAALIRQYFEEGWYPDGRKGTGPAMNPSGALVKAVLLNGAQTNMHGVDNGSDSLGNRQITPVTAYDNNIGFGRIDLSTSLYLEGFSEVQAEVWDRELVNDGETNQYEVTINRSSGCAFRDLSATLVWVEPASIGDCTRCVQNDLDITVTQGGTVHYPNGLNGKDDRNNAERVVVRNVGDGETLTINIIGANLNGPSQKFALVATGCFGGVANSFNKANDVFNTDNSGDSWTTTRIIIVAACSAFAFVFVCCCCSLLCHRRHQKKKKVQEKAKHHKASHGHHEDDSD